MAKKLLSAPTPIADSSESVSGKRKRKARRSRRSRKSSPKVHQLLPPVQPESLASEPVNEPAKDSGGLFDLDSLFSRSSQSEPNPPAQNGHGGGSTSTEALPPKVEAQLDAVPDVIGADPESPEAVGPAGALDDSGIAELMAAVAFEEQDVRDLLEELFEWLAARFESDHWRLTERQSRILGKPTAQLANSIWAQLRERIPDILARWCESTPGATAFLVACGVVVVPKVMTQFRKPRKPRAEEPRVPTVGRTHAQPVAPASYVRDYKKED